MLEWNEGNHFRDADIRTARAFSWLLDKEDDRAQEVAMVREIVRDEAFLGQKSERAGKEDISIARDLLDTLRAHAHHCVGLAANMIGRRKRVIAIRLGDVYLAMVNPEIQKNSAKTYKTSEGCLSLVGERETERHEWVEVKYRDMDFRKQKQRFTGFAAQIIQHEIDHCDGILI